MTDIQKLLNVENLERLSRNWDTAKEQTHSLMIPLSGSGNMFGGSGNGITVKVYGKCSVEETGKVEITGVYTYDYNIARGANGPTGSSATYYKGVLTLEDSRDEKHRKNVIGVTVTGSCGADDALASILYFKKDFLTKKA